MRALLYTLASCKHCARARELLRAAGAELEERPLDREPDLRRRLQRELGRNDYPLAVIDGELVGGLAEIERRAGRLGSEDPPGASAGPPRGR